MAIIGQDTFTGTPGALITARSPELGSWTKHGSSEADAVISDAGRCRGDTGAPSQKVIYYYPDPGVDNYEVELDANPLSVDSDHMGCTIRVVTGAETYYELYKDPDAALVRLAKVIAAAGTILAQVASTAGAAVNLRLRGGTGASALRFWINDVEQTPNNDSAITARGRPGLAGITSGGSPPGDGVHVHLDNFLVDDLLAGGPSYRPRRRRRSYVRM